MALSPELINLLRKIYQNPLGRLFHEQEEKLISLGLIRRWEDFLAVTELGRAALKEAEEGNSAD